MRLPFFAGTFYPGDRIVLQKKIDGLLSGYPHRKNRLFPRILIVPHAGVDYSGEVAAAGFSTIIGSPISKVILLGVSHSSWFPKAAVFDGDFWETPLGKVQVDKDLVKKILSGNNIVGDARAHDGEHCLEVELIFLQRALKNFKIVPVLVSKVTENLINELSDKIAEILDETSLLVVSTDLSHYPIYDSANKADKITIKGIVSGDRQIFENSVMAVETGNYTGLETAACGQDAITITLEVGKKIGASGYRLILYRNSGDTGGDKNSVVGYAAITGR